MLSTIELLHKYDIPGPRYTSYPTIPAWTNNQGMEPENFNNFRRSLEAISPNDPLSLYFHIPFCENQCHFCGCTRIITNDHSISKPYVETLIKELELLSSHLSSNFQTTHNPQLTTQIHFGGGSPNFLKPEELSQIMKSVHSHFTLQPNAEIAIEMNPRTTTEVFCENLYREGFNRISIGIQDFDDHVQKLINRFQTFDKTSGMIKQLRKIGFEHFNFDLVYGLPGQTLSSFQKTLEQVMELMPNRLAVYSYAHLPWKQPGQRSFNEKDIPKPELKIKLFEIAFDFFTKKGFELIGMDHFARKDDELYLALKNRSIHRNFMGYSTRANAHQIGLGATSISFANNNYFQNNKNIEEYQSLIFQNKLATNREMLLSSDDKIRRDLITDIMCHFFVDLEAFSKKHNIDFEKYFSKDLEKLSPIIEDKLLEYKKTHLQVFPQGRLVVRNIAMCFDNYLDDLQKSVTNPLFSRTV